MNSLPISYLRSILSASLPPLGRFSDSVQCCVARFSEEEVKERRVDVGVDVDFQSNESMIGSENCVKNQRCAL
jgi:hypothetical protein